MKAGVDDEYKNCSTPELRKKLYSVDTQRSININPKDLYFISAASILQKSTIKMSSSTTSHGKQFTLYVSAGPNPWKVVIILEELCLAYKTVVVDVNNGIYTCTYLEV